MKDRGKAFLESYRNSSPVPFLVIFSLFLVSRMLFLPFWKASMISPVTILSQYVRAAVLWLTFLYIAAFFVIQHVTIRTFLTGAVFAVTAMALCTHFIQNEMQYAVLMTVLLLLLLSYGRSFRRLMKAVLIAHCVILAVGMTGFLAGLTVGIYKYENYGQGFSFGMYYPNTFARIIFIILVLIWYLYLKDRKTILSFPAFWLPMIPVAFAAKCRTVSVLMFLFPLFAMLCRSATDNENGRVGRKQNAPAQLLIFLPVICWAVTLLLALQMEMLERLTADTALYNLSVRFVQAGIALKQYGVSLFPQHIAMNGTITAVLAGREERLLYLDSGYAFFTLRYGLLCIAAILAWLCAVNRRCLREGDRGLLLIALFFNDYGLMERMPMLTAHNFMLFYPLAAVPAVNAKETS